MNLKILSTILSMSVFFTPVMASGRNTVGSASAPPDSEVTFLYHDPADFFEAMLYLHKLKRKSAGKFISDYNRHLSNVKRIDFSRKPKKNLLVSLVENMSYISFVEYNEFCKYKEFILDDLYVEDKMYYYVDYLKNLWAEKLEYFSKDERDQRAMALLLNILILMRYCSDSNFKGYYWNCPENEDHYEVYEDTFLKQYSSNFIMSIGFGFYGEGVRSYKEFFNDIALDIIYYLEEFQDGIGEYILSLAYEMRDLTM